MMFISLLLCVLMWVRVAEAQNERVKFHTLKECQYDTLKFVNKNYGYDGALYLSGLLEFKYGQRTDEQKRIETLEADKRSIAKIFGLGKFSKSKPGPLLEIARELDA